MHRVASFLVFIMVFKYIYGELVDASHFEQQRAKVVYANPKYLKDVSVLTSRPNRKSGYMTSLNGTLTAELGNNVTGILTCYSTVLKMYAIKLEGKICDLLNYPWVKGFIESSSDIRGCPIPAGSYHIFAVELPPKNFPFPLEKSDYKVTGMLLYTKTKEKIAEAIMEFKYVEKKRHG